MACCMYKKITEWRHCVFSLVVQQLMFDIVTKVYSALLYWYKTTFMKNNTQWPIDSVLLWEWNCSEFSIACMVLRREYTLEYVGHVEKMDCTSPHSAKYPPKFPTCVTKTWELVLKIINYRQYYWQYELQLSRLHFKFMVSYSESDSIDTQISYYQCCLSKCDTFNINVYFFFVYAVLYSIWCYMFGYYYFLFLCVLWNSRGSLKVKLASLNVYFLVVKKLILIFLKILCSKFKADSSRNMNKYNKYNKYVKGISQGGAIIYIILTL